MSLSIPFKKTDGGRADAGFKGRAGDCVARALAIASGVPYRDVYNRLAHGNSLEKKRGGKRGQRSARNGIFTTRKWFKSYMAELGFDWTATMGIGTGCKVHVRADELPAGRLVLNVSNHSCAVIDGVLHDAYDCSREGKRCVYGYWKQVRPAAPGPTPAPKKVRVVGPHRGHVKKLGSKLGASFEDDGDTIRVTAPEGHHWAGADVHELVHGYIDGKPDIQDILDRMGEGVAPCTADSCPGWYEGSGCDWWSEDQDDAA